MSTYHIRFNRFGNGGNAMVLKMKKGHKIEHRRPKYGLCGGQHLGGHHCGNGIRGIVESIDEIKDEGQGWWWSAGVIIVH